jgi:hypothetical protein
MSLLSVEVLKEMDTAPTKWTSKEVQEMWYLIRVGNDMNWVSSGVFNMIKNLIGEDRIKVIKEEVR